MGWIYLTEILADSGRKNRKRFPDDVVVLSTDLYYAGTPRASYVFRVSIGNKIAKQARFLVGDRVDLAIDVDTRVALLKRVQKGGYSLTNAGGKKTERITLKAKYKLPLPSVAESLPCEATVTDEGIVFELPEECSFTENLREKAEQQKK